MTGRRWQPPVIRIVCAGVSTVAVAAVGATALVPAMNVATVNIMPAAAIDDSGSTIGFSDPYLYGATPAQIDQQLDQMQALGVNDVRVLIPWAGVEPVQGYYDWSSVDYTIDAANARGMGVLGVLNSSPQWAVNPGVPAISGAPASPAQYGDFAGLVAQRYAGKVSAYEIWNEPNGQTYYAPKPDPAAYTELLKAAYPEIKAADPNATVIGGVTGAVVDYGDFTMNPVTFVKGIYAAGGEGYFDALSFHPYNYGTPFSQGASLPDSPLNQLTEMRDVMVANGDASKQIWASEYGEPTSVATEDQQAAFIKDMLTTWPTLGYTGPTFIDTLNDVDSSSTDPEDTLGVIRSDGTLKPAAYVIQQLAEQRDTTPAMAQLALAMPGATAADPADVAKLTKLAQTPDAPAVTPADAAAVAALATTPTVAQPTDPAAVMAANVNAMAGAVGTQLEASANAAGTALQASVQAAAVGFQKQVAAMMGAKAPATATANKAATPAATATKAATDAATPTQAATKATTKAATSPAAIPATQPALTSLAPTKTTGTKTAAAQSDSTAKTSPKHQKADATGSSHAAPAASSSDKKPKHAKG
ncbi:cellulase family glycosylhydrolase [Mycolicibacterium madagascariense]|uniref:cellulase family glycosylhydrolase n=1 Tax=Mycolicibacterium madagascariense TaxID=212765 RepID=UPI0013D5B489|nr:cellulase family glycosylhydrolase [Mycolicibacterium madagascariense]MCV7014815.1 cellulase family glycosylhydrolase [Mycolicibacterium madagascariense]